ncbi:hypothetical protein ES288_A11G003300v1 [Gossypium darwinii]|uniref:Uncharacterized protein n=1 Tax=Gossypium darwinii TaxID=34276 RepID=A0A5D2EFW2_GOSDA|nr:hypothetical protein ES288_A11G003300v1 [Gossypium darwinii]
MQYPFPFPIPISHSTVPSSHFPFPSPLFHRSLLPFPFPFPIPIPIPIINNTNSSSNNSNINKGVFFTVEELVYFMQKISLWCWRRLQSFRWKVCLFSLLGNWVFQVVCVNYPICFLSDICL